MSGYKKIGILREGKVPPDKRVTLSPEHCKELITRFPEIDLVVQKSEIRAFKDEEYEAAGINLAEDISDRDLLIGVKEVPIAELIPDKAYLFFSHTTKKQPYNKGLLQGILDKEITLIDHELLENERGHRVIAFGRYAGIVGAYNGIRAYVLQELGEEMKPAHACHDQIEMESQLDLIKLPEDMKVVLTGTGRVGSGAMEILKRAGMRETGFEDLAGGRCTGPCFHALDTEDIYIHSTRNDFVKDEFYADPSDYRSVLVRKLEKADMYIACHYWNPNGPILLQAKDYAYLPRLKVIADISCDIKEPIASTLRPSTISEPFYGYDHESNSEVPFGKVGSIGVMAVDNLPCELPRDSSMAFGQQFLEYVASNMIQSDPSGMIRKATIASKGKLTPDYDYLADWLAETD